MILKQAPRSFDSKFSVFFTEFVEPNLPSPDRVREFDDLLKRYCTTADPVFVIRTIQGLERGRIYQTDGGEKFLPSDNSPGWWLHARLMSDEALSRDPTVLFRSMPTHMFQIRLPQTLNNAGFHLAHIIPAKNRDTQWKVWRRDELVRRFTLNIHPCNWFLLGKPEWQKWGANEVVLSWIRDRYYRRYGDLFGSMPGNLNLPVAGFEFPKTVEDPRYSFNGENATQASAALPADGSKRTSTSDATTLTKHVNRPQVRKAWLNRGVTLEITMFGSRFFVAHDDLWNWVQRNTNVPNTKSWKDGGIYHWPPEGLPAKIRAFLAAYEVD